MGRNVFVSYKYWDNSILQIDDEETIVRDYVDIIEDMFQSSREYYYRGEHDGEDLSDLHYKEVEKVLSDKIFRTSITIVLISPEMFENISEIEQWIPWEISYSLRNKLRYDGNSYMNAIIAVVLPDRNGRYGYALHSKKDKVFVRKEAFFEILLKNMFNRKYSKQSVDEYGNPEYVPGDSYVVIAKWGDFYNNPELFLKQALKNRGSWAEYIITKKLKKQWIS